MSLASCERAVPVVEKSEETPTDPALAAAQLTLAKNHLAHNEPEMALAYLSDSSQTSASTDAKDLLTETLSSTRFTIPSILLRHPYPVLGFTEDSGKALFVALGGKHPTVVRWSLGETPEVTAVLFPTDASSISHISLSPDGLHLLVHRDKTNLLCDATTLKPITNLGEFPANLNPDTCQPFSGNGLLLAHPVKTENGNYLWHIRDTATGENIRIESIAQYPEPLEAAFDGTNLMVIFKDRTNINIPIRGETKTSNPDQRLVQVPRMDISPVLIDECTIALMKKIPIPDNAAHTHDLLGAISGYELDPKSQTLLKIPTPNRLATLSEQIPGEIPPTLKLFSSEIAVEKRLAAAYPQEFPEIAAAQIAHAEIIRKTFESGDPTAIAAVIDSAEQGLPLATSLFLSLETRNPSYIQRSAAKADNMPAALRSLVRNESATISDPSSLRLEQDWIGYESPDFSPLFRKSSHGKSAALSQLILPDDPSENDIESFVIKILDPNTESNLGRAAIAQCAIQSASSLAKHPDKAMHAIRLSTIAQRYGANPSLCLRINAIAFTSLGDFTSAHRTWIDLITNQPEATHFASDYSEAAYTAFETDDARQAMEILHTGLFRFQNDVAFAIRAGWISLLTDHPTEALDYLTHATKLGLPPTEIENTTALLAIIHSQLGDPKSANGYLAQLQAISPKWGNAQNIDALPWPETLKATLKEIISLQPETEPAPSPESDPIHTAPRSEQFPIPEPPLPSR